jgi:hypothetical protein
LKTNEYAPELFAVAHEHAVLVSIALVVVQLWRDLLAPSPLISLRISIGQRLKGERAVAGSAVLYSGAGRELLQPAALAIGCRFGEFTYEIRRAWSTTVRMTALQHHRTLYFFRWARQGDENYVKVK